MHRKAEPEKPWDYRRKNGQTVIRIYPRKRGGYVFRYRIGGGEKIVERVDREKIIAEADRIAKGIDAGLAQTGTLTAADMEAYVHARAQLREGDPPLHAIVAEWRALREGVGHTPISDLVGLWKRAGRRAGGAEGSSLVQDLSDRYLVILGERYKNSPSKRNLNGFVADLPRFCREFGARPIAEIGAGEIEKWLRQLGVGTRRQDNLREKVVTFFRWARDEKFLDEERKTEPEKVPKVDKHTKEVEYWTPAEMRQLIAAVSPKWLPCLVISAFAGLRISEIVRLRWEAFAWSEKRIYVRASVALKTSKPRRVPIPDNLMEWLQPYQGQKGPIVYTERNGERVPYKDPMHEWTDETARIARVTGIKWRANNSRHAYGTFQMALLDDYAQVSARMGNSIAKVQTNYDGVGSPHDAQAYQSIRPDRADGKVVSIGKAG